MRSPWTKQREAADERRKTYIRLTREIAEYNADQPEHRRARAGLQARTALDSIEAAERNTDVIARATWALVAVTVALVLATVALIVVTATR